MVFLSVWKRERREKNLSCLCHLNLMSICSLDHAETFRCTYVHCVSDDSTIHCSSILNGFIISFSKFIHGFVVSEILILNKIHTFTKTFMSKQLIIPDITMILTRYSKTLSNSNTTHGIKYFRSKKKRKKKTTMATNIFFKCIISNGLCIMLEVLLNGENRSSHTI